MSTSSVSDQSNTIKIYSKLISVLSNPSAVFGLRSCQRVNVSMSSMSDHIKPKLIISVSFFNVHRLQKVKIMKVFFKMLLNSKPCRLICKKHCESPKRKVWLNFRKIWHANKEENFKLMYGRTETQTGILIGRLTNANSNDFIGRPKHVLLVV